jgi:hypothetical protein
LGRVVIDWRTMNSGLKSSLLAVAILGEPAWLQWNWCGYLWAISALLLIVAAFIAPDPGTAVPGGHRTKRG